MAYFRGGFIFTFFRGLLTLRIQQVMKTTKMLTCRRTSSSRDYYNRRITLSYPDRENNPSQFQSDIQYASVQILALLEARVISFHST